MQHDIGKIKTLEKPHTRKRAHELMLNARVPTRLKGKLWYIAHGEGQPTLDEFIVVDRAEQSLRGTP